MCLNSKVGLMLKIIERANSAIRICQGFPDQPFDREQALKAITSILENLYLIKMDLSEQAQSVRAPDPSHDSRSKIQYDCQAPGELSESIPASGPSLGPSAAPLTATPLPASTPFLRTDDKANTEEAVRLHSNNRRVIDADRRDYFVYVPADYND